MSHCINMILETNLRCLWLPINKIFHFSGSTILVPLKNGLRESQNKTVDTLCVVIFIYPKVNI
jgi:hypothetical protein